MSSFQPVPLYSLESVIPYVSDEFGMDISERQLFETSIVPIRRIGNYHTKPFSEIITISEGGTYPLPCRTFFIHSVFGKECDFSITDMHGNEQFLNNPYPVVEYVNRSTLVDYENIRNEYDQIIGYVKNGKYYDKLGTMIGEAKAVSELSKCHGKYGNLYQIPVSYKVLDKCLVFDKEKGGKQLKIDAEFLQEDKKGLPLIDEPTKIAIAYYMNLIEIRKRYFASEASYDQFQVAKKEYEEKAAAAKSDLFINENLKEKIIQILSSFDRSGYKHTYFK